MTGAIPLLSITKDVLDINRDFVNTMIDIFNELSHNPPFPGWKDELKELWNWIDYITAEILWTHNRLGDFKAIRVDNTIRVLNQAEFLCK